MGRMFRQRRAAYYSPGVGPEFGPDAPLLGLTDLYLSNGCCCHDAQNSLKWALSPACGGEVLTEVHIAAESLRN
eukprot:9351946-Lingulodinium_polyedra.AAC.1